MAAPTWPAITSDEAAAALARFPLAGRLERLCWHSPRPFSAATLVDTGLGRFVLKRHHRRLRTPDGLAEEHRFIAHLARAGLAVPEVIAVTGGASAVGHGDWTYELHRVAEGADLYRDRQSWTPFLAPTHARAAGVALARLHRASHGYAAPARAPQPLVASFTILPAADPMAAADADVAARPALAALLAPRSWRRTLGSLFDTVGAGLGALTAQPALWTHNDWHPSNLLWDAGAVRTVFDFGLADRSCALHDLATAIERSAVRWLDLDTDDDIGAAGAALDLIAGYATILPLTPADRALLVRLLPLVHVEFALSEIDYFAGILGDEASAVLAWDGYLLGHAAWFGSAAGRDFLRAIGGGGTG